MTNLSNELINNTIKYCTENNIDMQRMFAFINNIYGNSEYSIISDIYRGQFLKYNDTYIFIDDIEIIDVADDVTKKKVESSVEDIKLSRFSEMEESEILKIVEMHRKKAPIKIPESANVKAKSMNEGYEQISYKWNDGIYKYEVRWHTRTPGAPKDQGNTWVIQRTKPGNGGQKPSTQFLIGDNEWVEGWKWYDAIKARKEGTATKEQIEILDRGHWKE